MMPVLEDAFQAVKSEPEDVSLSNSGDNDDGPQKGNPIASEREINTDGRDQYDWKSKYPVEALREMRNEAIYIAAILIFALSCLLLLWLGFWEDLLCLDTTRGVIFNGMAYYFLSGLLGGTIFGMKYFYRAIARGYWSQDRRWWRIFSPWISSAIALIIGCMVVSGFVNSAKEPSNYLAVCVGFFAGYFADDAVGKMSEVAKALFGSSGKAK